MKLSLKTTVSSLLLILAALIWGVAFVAQSIGGDAVGPFTFLFSRSMIAGVALLPLILFRRRKIAERIAAEGKKPLLIGGIACGSALAVASVLQQIGIIDPSVTAGKAGFITALYIVLVPLFGIFLRKKVALFLWISVALAAIGMYLLCITEKFTIARGDFFVLLCAGCFAVHILLIDHFSPRCDGVTMACIQFFTCGTLAGICMLIFESPTLAGFREALIPILYTGLFSSGVGYTLQIVAQKNLPATLASVIMSLESVFSVLAGWLILRETLSARELGGCALVFAAVILAQLPPEIFKRKRAAGNIEK